MLTSAGEIRPLEEMEERDHPLCDFTLSRADVEVARRLKIALDALFRKLDEAPQ